MSDIKLDDEFRSIIPPLTDEERAGLESSLKAEGCRDALVVWNGTLIDGHNRLEICKANNIEYEVKRIDLPDRRAAINWIINNQLNRRNVTPEQASYLRGQRYNREKLPLGGAQYRSRSENQNSMPGVRTNVRLGKEYKVSHDTIHKDGKFAAAVDKLAATHGPELRKRILQRDSRVPKRAVIAAAQEDDPKAQLDVLDNPPATQKAKPSGNGTAGNKAPRSEKAERIRGLTEQGYRATQIASELDISAHRVRDIAREYGITLVDKALGNSRPIKIERVIEGTVTSMEGLATGLELVDIGDLSGLDPDQCREWWEVLTTSMKAISRLRKQLEGVFR